MRISEIHQSFNAEPFREGLCYALAFTLNRRFGWQIAVMASEDEELHTIHGFVILPTGQALDIDGPKPVQQLIDDYAGGEEGWRTVELSPGGLMAILNSGIRPTPQDIKLANAAIDQHLIPTWPETFGQKPR